MSTLEIIAREIGVSPRTVSNVLNGKNKENWDSTALRAAKIREVAERVGYQPNVMARAVRTGKSRIIGLVTKPGTMNYSGEIETGILKEVSSRGYTIKLMPLPSNPTVNQLNQLSAQCAAAKLEGVVALSLDEKEMVWVQKQMTRAGFPVAFVGGIPPQNSIGVYSDVPLSVRFGLTHLVSLGHRQICFLCGPLGSSLTQLLMDAFQEIMREFGLPVCLDNVAPSDWVDAEIIAAAANRLLDLPEPPTAIFAVSDVQALVTYSAARRRGLKLPDNLSVLCYGQLPQLAYTDPPLTTIVQPSTEIGHLAVQCLLTQIEGDKNDGPFQPLLIKDGIYLVERGSTAPPIHL